MRRALVGLATLAFLMTSALTAQADSPSGTIPPCANINAGTGTYDATTGKLHMEVRLNAAPCNEEPVFNEDGTTTTTTVDYDLYVIRDRTWDGDPTGEKQINLLNLTGPWDQIELVSDDDFSTDPSLVTQITAPGAHVITYDLVVDDDDPTVCVFSVVSGTVVTTEQVEVANEPVDENGNGNTVDDTHSGNGGENNKNKPPGKFDWGTHTETREVSRAEFFDRAPDTDVVGADPLSSLNCRPIDSVTSIINQVTEDLGFGQGYH